MLAVFNPNGTFDISDADDALIREIDSVELELVGGGLDGACDNNVVCGATTNVYCVAPNAVCNTGSGGTNAGCANVACSS